MADRVFTFDGDLSGFISSLEEAQQEIDQFTEQVDEAGQELDEMGDQADEAGSATEDAGKKTTKAGGEMKAGFNAAAVAAAAAALAIAGAVTAVLDFAEATNQIAKRAKEVGTSAVEYQKLQGVLDLMTRGGIDASFVINTLARNVDEAAQGNEEYAASFRRLGINLDDFRKLTPTEQIATFADALDNVEDRAARAAISMELMGRQGKFLGPAFDGGGDAIRKAAQSIEDAGVVSNETAAQSEALADASLLLGNTFNSLKADILEPLIPRLADAAEQIQEIILAAQEEGEIKELGEALADAFAEDTIQSVIDAVDAFVSLVDILDDVVRVVGAVLDLISAGPDLVFAWTKSIRSGFQDFTALKEEFNEIAQALERIGLAKRQANVDDFADPLLSAGVTPSGDIPIGGNILQTTGGGGGGGGGGRGGGNDALEKELAERAKLEEKALKEAATRADAAAEAEKDRQALITKYHQQAQDARVETVTDALREIGEAYEESAAQAVAAAEAAAQAQEDIAVGFVSVLTSVSASISRLAWAVADQKIEAAQAGSEAEQAAAIEAFEAAQAVALINAGISTALAMIEGLAAGLAIGGPAGIALGFATLAAAATAGGIAIGEIASATPPSFKEGGRVPGFGVVNIDAHGGEEIATRAAAARNPGVVDAMNAGDVMGAGGGSQVVVLKVNNRTTEAQLHANLRTGAGSLNEKIRTLESHSIGHRLPAGFGERG